MKKRITQEDINFSRMFCFDSSVASEQRPAQGGEDQKQPDTTETVPETPVSNESGIGAENYLKKTLIGDQVNFRKNSGNVSTNDTLSGKPTETVLNKGRFISYGPDIGLGDWTVKTSSEGVSLSGKPISVRKPSKDDIPTELESAQETQGATSNTAPSAATESNSPQKRKLRGFFKPVGNTGLKRMVVADEDGNEIPLEEAREKWGLPQEDYEKIKNHNSIIDRSQETASNRMRDMWIRKGEKMSDWWKRLDDEQKMGLIGGGFLGGGLLLSNMNKKKRGLGDYISHYGIPAAIAGLGVYGGSAWNADENTYNLGRYKYLVDQAQQQKPGTTTTA